MIRDIIRVMGAKAMTKLAIFQDPMFHNEDKAREALEAELWPNGPYCRHCGNSDDWRSFFKLHQTPDGSSPRQHGTWPGSDPGIAPARDRLPMDVANHGPGYRFGCRTFLCRRTCRFARSIYVQN